MAFQGVVGLFAAFRHRVGNYFRPYLSFPACALEAQHSNENCSTIKRAILLKFTHFQLYIQNKQLGLLVALGLPHVLTVIYVFKKRFY